MRQNVNMIKQDRLVEAMNRQFLALTESYQANGQRLGESGLAQLAGQLDAGEPELFIIRLLELIAAQQQGNLEQDDLTAVLF